MDECAVQAWVLQGWMWVLQGWVLQAQEGGRAVIWENVYHRHERYKDGYYRHNC